MCIYCYEHNDWKDAIINELNKLQAPFHENCDMMSCTNVTTYNISLSKQHYTIVIIIAWKFEAILSSFTIVFSFDIKMICGHMMTSAFVIELVHVKTMCYCAYITWSQVHLLLIGHVNNNYVTVHYHMICYCSVMLNNVLLCTITWSQMYLLLFGHV